jgi:hypothetical protein
VADFGNKLQGEEANVGEPLRKDVDQGLTALLNGGFQAAEDKANELVQAFVNASNALRNIPGVTGAEDNQALRAVFGVSALGVVKTVLPALHGRCCPTRFRPSARSIAS